MSTPKKQKRPLRSSATRAATVNLTLRLPPKLLEQLRQSAAVNQRSIAAEAQKRLAQAEVNDIARMVGFAVEAEEQRSGKVWSADAESRRKCRMAVGAVLDLLLCDDTELKKLVRDIQAQIQDLHSMTAPEKEAQVATSFRSVLEFVEARSAAVEAIVGASKQ